MGKPPLLLSLSLCVYVCNLTDMCVCSRSLNFNIVSKGQGSNRMSFYLNEAAGEIRDLMLPTVEPPKAKL